MWPYSKWIAWLVDVGGVENAGVADLALVSVISEQVHVNIPLTWSYLLAKKCHFWAINHIFGHNIENSCALFFIQQRGSKK